MYKNVITITCQEANALIEVLSNSKNNYYDKECEWLKNFVENSSSPIVNFVDLPYILQNLYPYLFIGQTDTHIICQEFYKKYRPAQILNNKLRVSLPNNSKAKFHCELRELMRNLCADTNYQSDCYDYWYPHYDEVEAIFEYLTEIITQNPQAPSYVYIFRKDIYRLGQTITKLKEKEAREEMRIKHQNEVKEYIQKLINNENSKVEDGE